MRESTIKYLRNVLGHPYVSFELPPLAMDFTDHTRKALVQAFEDGILANDVLSKADLELRKITRSQNRNSLIFILELIEDIIGGVNNE